MTGRNPTPLLAGINHTAVLTADVERLAGFCTRVFDAHVISAIIVLAAGGLVPLTAGAVVVHVRADDRFPDLAPALLLGLLAAGFVVLRVVA